MRILEDAEAGAGPHHEAVEAGAAFNAASRLQTGLQAARLSGIAQQLDPGPRLDLNMYVAGAAVEGARRLPLNLLDAVRAFEASPSRAGLGEAFSASFAQLKRQEWDSYRRHLTQWERDATLDC